MINPPSITCTRCRGKLDFPLYCKQCEKLFCSKCFNTHNWESLQMERGMINGI